MPEKETVAGAPAGTARESSVPFAWDAALYAAAASNLLYWAGCKLALWASLAYQGSDFYICLQMSKSFLYTGVPLYTNTYGQVAAIHNNYLLLFFFPLTYALGGYGLILGLLGLHALAMVRVLRTPILSFWGRLAVLGAVLSPVSFWVLDDPLWGFHVELCNVPLGVLFTLALLERRRPAAALLGLALGLVKEDGAILVAAILIAYFCGRLRLETARARVLLRAAGACLIACAVAFLAGLAILGAVGRNVAATQLTSTARLDEAIRVTLATLAGTGPPDWSTRLWRGLGDYGLLALCSGLPLLRRLPVYLLLFAAGSLPLIPALVVSSAPYGFGVMLWSPRVAAVVALASACLAITAALSPPKSWQGARPAVLLVSLVLIGAGWATGGALLRWRLGYRFVERADLVAAISGSDQPIARLREDELRFARCLASALPRDFPLGMSGPQTPLFHQQALVFFGPQSRPWQAPRLAILFRARGEPAPPQPLARVRRLFVTGDEEFAPLLRRCVERSPPP